MKHKTFLLFVISLFSFQVSNAQPETEYYFTKTISGTFDEVTQKVKDALKKEGFGIVSEMDMDKTLREKLEKVDMKPYRILGACNPDLAYQSLQIEENLGLFLPCKVVIKQIDEHSSEVVMINPAVLIIITGNSELLPITNKVAEKFKSVLKGI